MRGNTLKVLSLLSGIEHPLSVCVIIGPMVKNPGGIIRAAEKLCHCTVIMSPEDYDERIAGADLGFIGGGTTMLEFCSLGIPVIVIPQNDAEMRFASLFEQNGAVTLLKDEYPDDRRKEIISGMIEDRDALSRMSAVQMKMVDRQGKDRIADIIVSGFD